MNIKRHYKLYKSGKVWKVVAIAFGTIAGMYLIMGNANADVANQPVASTNIQQQQESNTKQEVKNEWQASANNTWTYYNNGQVKSGLSYDQLPAINGQGSNWYLVNNGVAQSGVQGWQGSYWYFDPQTYLLTHQREFVKSQWGTQYLVGSDGKIQSGVQEYQGQIYDFDPVTYMASNRRAYAQANNGNWYLVDHGKAQSGVQEWQGSYWYFNPKTYLLTHQRGFVKSQWGTQYLVGSDGKIQSGVQEYQGQIYDFDPVTYMASNRRAYAQANNGNWYLVDHGKAQNGVQEWQGSYWYFDPNTYLLYKKQNYIQSQWGDWYMVGNDGRIQSGLVNWMGNLYYFDPVTYLRTDNKDFYVNGVKYHADQDGRVKALNLVNIDTIKTYMINQAWGDERTANNKYIILHEVGVETGAATNAAYFYNQTKASVNNENVQGVYSTFVVGDGGKIYQVSQPGKVSWAAGGANIDSPVQIELGRTWNANQFWQDYKAYVNLARSYALAYGIPLTLDAGGKDTPGIKSHLWVTNNVWYGGGHTDPYGYLNRFGVTQAKLAHDLQFGL